jgi:hypothetical protein
MTVRVLTQVVDAELGEVRLERWPEGCVLWIGGAIVYRSWDAPARAESKPRAQLRRRRRA